MAESTMAWERPILAESASLPAESDLLDKMNLLTILLVLIVVIFLKKKEKLVRKMSLKIGGIVDREEMNWFDVDLKTPSEKIPAILSALLASAMTFPLFASVAQMAAP
jgi:hypothetical protein